MLQDITANAGFIVGFLVTTIVIANVAGERVAAGFLFVVLIGMVFTNMDIFKNLALAGWKGV